MIQKLRREFPLAILLEIAQLPRATFYYHLKKRNHPDKYEAVKAEITAIYHENKGRYGYRRIKAKLKGLPPAIHRQQTLSAACTIFLLNIV